MWVRLDEIFEINPKNTNSDSDICGFVPMANVDDGFSGTHSYKERKWGEVKKGYCHFQNGDIAVAKISPCFENLKSTIFHSLPNNIGAGTTELVILRGHLVYGPYFLYLFKSQWYIGKGIVYFKGVVGQQRVNRDIFTSLEVPLPPLNEQRRIVSVIQRLFAVIDIVENNSCELKYNIEATKQKVLELAITGKLVPQDPTDEPAADLLQRVNPNAVVSADTSHYQHLPQGWCVCKLEDIVDYEQPQRYIVETTEYSDAYKTPVLTAGKSFVIGHTNEITGVYDNVPVIIFDDFTTDSKYVDFPFKVKSSAMKILHVKSAVNIKYVYYFMSITRLVGKTHKRYWISEYSKLDIPLPPYNEQCRIVDAIERINNRIDDITEAL